MAEWRKLQLSPDLDDDVSNNNTTNTPAAANHVDYYVHEGGEMMKKKKQQQKKNTAAVTSTSMMWKHASLKLKNLPPAHPWSFLFNQRAGTALLHRYMPKEDDAGILSEGSWTSERILVRLGKVPVL